MSHDSKPYKITYLIPNHMVKGSGSGISFFSCVSSFLDVIERGEFYNEQTTQNAWNDCFYVTSHYTAVVKMCTCGPIAT